MKKQHKLFLTLHGQIVKNVKKDINNLIKYILYLAFAIKYREKDFWPNKGRPFAMKVACGRFFFIL